MVSVINSKDNPKIKEILKLRKPSYMKEKGLFILETPHLVKMALENNLLDSVFTLKELEYIPYNIPQYIVSEDIMKKISNLESSPGVLALAKLITPKDITSSELIYLDNIQDPGNVGTIIRTALSFGYKDIIFSPNTCSIYNSKVVQASQGALLKINPIVMDYDELIALKKKGYSLLVTTLKSSTYLNEINFKDKYVLIFGNEARGVNDKLINESDLRIKIKISDIDSLNVAVASSITMYHFKNQ